jgi:hypothetical protein
MTPSILLVSFLFAATTAQTTQPADATPAAKPVARARACATALLPPFEVPHVPVSFEVPKPKPKPRILSTFLKESKAKRNCDGTWCGCDIDAEECRASCDPGDSHCLLACDHAYTHCAVCCCCDCPYCPLYCGC